MFNSLIKKIAKPVLISNGFIKFFLDMAILRYVVIFSVTSLLCLVNGELSACQGAGLKYLNGDALTGSTSCLGPDHTPYPT